jgi:hypothetical protein
MVFSTLPSRGGAGGFAHQLRLQASPCMAGDSFTP